MRTHGWEVTADVEKEYYKALRRFIVAAARPCGSDRLLAYKDDLRARIRESPLFDSYVVVQVTGEVERMLVARCTAAQFGVKPARLAKELQRLWATSCASGTWRRTSCASKPTRWRSTS